MRKVGHLTPGYVKNRLQEMVYQKTNRDKPWLTQQANLALDSLLKPSDVGIEWGSGRSTQWFAHKIRFVTSIEHDRRWYDIVLSQLAEADVKNVDYRYTDGVLGVDAESFEIPYLQAVVHIPAASIDFALVDGCYRGHCAALAINKLKSGGLLVIDNVNWFLPTKFNSPASRTASDGPKPGIWTDVWGVIKDWRVVWTTSGVTDTAIFFKP